MSIVDDLRTERDEAREIAANPRLASDPEIVAELLKFAELMDKAAKDIEVLARQCLLSGEIDVDAIIRQQFARLQ